MVQGVLVVTELFLPTKGGTAVWFDEVYRRLGGKEIHIVTAAVEGDGDHDVIHPNTIHRLGLRRVPWLRPESLAMYGKMFFKCLSLTISHRFCAVHAGRVLPEGLVAWVVGRLIGRPIAIYAHGEELTGWGRGNKFRVMRFALRHADRVIANSEFTRITLISMGVQAERIVVIHPGVDVERFCAGLPSDDLRDAIGLDAGGRLILSVGRLQRRKGFDMVINSLPKLVAAGHNVHYAVIGIGEDQRYLSELACHCGVADRVHLLGHVPMVDLPRWYNACQVFILPNREVGGDTEGFWIVFLEAAACGKVAVAGTAGGTGSAVIDGETGLRVDGENLDAIIDVLDRVLSDQAFSSRLSANAIKRVRRELTWDSVAERTKALLRPGTI